MLRYQSLAAHLGRSLSLCLACLGPDCRFIACNGKKSEAQARRQGQGAAQSMARCAVLALWFIGMQPALARAVVHELSLYPASSWSRRALGLPVTLQVSTDRKRFQLRTCILAGQKFGCTAACRSIVGIFYIAFTVLQCGTEFKAAAEKSV